MDYDDLRVLITHELDQQDQTGYDTTTLRAALAQAEGGAGGAHDETLRALLDRAQAECAAAPSALNEPSDLEEIAALWPSDHRGVSPRPQDYDDRLLAGWRGRVIGNMLGKPVEEGVYWTRERLRDYVRDAGAEPLSDYFPAPAHLRERYELRADNWAETTLGSIDGSSRDDDVDYTILNLHVLERYGLGFTSDDVAKQWLHLLPYEQTYTAERKAYKNLVNGVRPPGSAIPDNPFREWIGALIRADVFGYVTPGDPRRAAELAYRDARVSHIANGIYAEQWAAALVAAAFTSATAREALDQARCYVPQGSRTAVALDHVVGAFDAGRSWDETLTEVDERWAGYHWVHAVNNVAVIAAALLHGEGSFTRSIALTVLGGLDTDSNGATSGSVAGILHGTAGIESHWWEPIGDRVRSAVFGYDEISVTELARRTRAVADDGA
ncbi:ADP-ribosylglycohydrolase family protein [Pseudactinotalea suaedae]|uniref:ADP-ribosylglycohydrolase family protein n=1 Tax=Pseudactinotalea suaedae TaxID=1524924 RepID=UPI0019D54FA0|nr:ADP-ribosylglycohydrolase family protein [Pseudactinotalea suaedae]